MLNLEVLQSRTLCLVTVGHLGGNQLRRVLVSFYLRTVNSCDEFLTVTSCYGFTQPAFQSVLPRLSIVLKKKKTHYRVVYNSLVIIGGGWGWEV